MVATNIGYPQCGYADLGIGHKVAFVYLVQGPTDLPSVYVRAVEVIDEVIVESGRVPQIFVPLLLAMRRQGFRRRQLTSEEASREKLGCSLE